MDHWPIILEPNDGTLHGERIEDVQRAVDAGVLYLCPVDDGSCPEGHHKGGGFYHYRPGKTPEDYDSLQ